MLRRIMITRILKKKMITKIEKGYLIKHASDSWMLMINYLRESTHTIPIGSWQQIKTQRKYIKSEFLGRWFIMNCIIYMQNIVLIIVVSITKTKRKKERQIKAGFQRQQQM